MKPRRPFALLVLLCQLILAAAAPIADARLEAEAILAGSELHVEDAESGACSPTHNHETCVICRGLQVLDAGLAADMRLVPTSTFSRPSTPCPEHDPRVAALVAAHGPRAPPV